MFDFKRSAAYLMLAHVKNLYDSTCKKPPNFSTQGFEEIASVVKRVFHLNGISQEDYLELLLMARDLELYLLAAQKTDRQILEAAAHFFAIFNWLKNCPPEFFKPNSQDYQERSNIEIIADMMTRTYAGVSELPRKIVEADPQFVEDFKNFIDLRNKFFESCSAQDLPPISSVYAVFMRFVYLCLVVSATVMIINEFVLAVPVISKNHMLPILAILVLSGLWSNLDCLSHIFRLIRSDSDNAQTLLSDLFSYCEKMESSPGWRAFAFDSELKPRSLQEFAEKFFTVLASYNPDECKKALKEYLIDIHAPENFDVKAFIEELENQSVSDNGLQVIACYSDDISHENIMQWTTEIIQAMHHQPSLAGVFSGFFYPRKYLDNQTHDELVMQKKNC